MTENRFRLLITLYVIVTLAAGASGFLPNGYSEELRVAYEIEPYPLTDTPLAALILLALFALAVGVAGLVGLYRFKAWGRSLCLWTSLGSLPLLLTLGPTLTSSLEGALWEASTMLWGAVLAVAYFSPVASSFRANQLFKPKPPSGSA